MIQKSLVALSALSVWCSALFFQNAFLDAPLECLFIIPPVIVLVIQSLGTLSSFYLILSFLSGRYLYHYSTTSWAPLLPYFLIYALQMLCNLKWGLQPTFELTPHHFHCDTAHEVPSTCVHHGTFHACTPDESLAKVVIALLKNPAAGKQLAGVVLGTITGVQTDFTFNWFFETRDVSVERGISMREASPIALEITLKKPYTSSYINRYIRLGFAERELCHLERGAELSDKLLGQRERDAELSDKLLGQRERDAKLSLAIETQKSINNSRNAAPQLNGNILSVKLSAKAAGIGKSFASNGLGNGNGNALAIGPPPRGGPQL